MQSTLALGMWIGNAILSKRILPMPVELLEHDGTHNLLLVVTITTTEKSTTPSRKITGQ